MALFNLIATAVQETVNPAVNSTLPHMDRVPAIDQFIDWFMPIAQVVYVIGVAVAFVRLSLRFRQIHTFVTKQVRLRAREDGIPDADDLEPPLRYHLFTAYHCALYALSWPLVMILKPEEMETL